MKKNFLIIASCFFVFLFLVGCEDVEDRTRAEDFGAENNVEVEESESESEVIDTQLSGSFICDSDWGIVLPFDEDLCWLREVGDEISPWGQASSYCFEKSKGDLSWSAPTKEDWEALVDYLKSRGVTENFGSYLNNNYGFRGFEDKYYWSETFYGPLGPSFVSWFVDLENGVINTWNMDHGLNVACVSRN